MASDWRIYYKKLMFLSKRYPFMVSNCPFILSLGLACVSIMIILTFLLLTNMCVVKAQPSQQQQTANNTLSDQQQQTANNKRSSISIEDYRRLHDYLLVNYTKHIRPLYDQSEDLQVSCTLEFKSILSYDVVNGVFSFSGELETEWKDEMLTWDSNDFGGLSLMRIAADKLWMPNIGIENSAENGDFLNTDGLFLSVNNDGIVGAKYSGMMRTTCTPDAYYYPFDVHTCTVVLVVFGYSSNEIFLNSLNIRDDTQALLRHSEWEVELGEIQLSNEKLPMMSATVLLSRRSTNIFLKTLLPLSMLVILQVLVFILPAESGERISYSITMFLSYAVFMTIVAESIPPSNPVPLIYNFLTFLLINGAFIILVNILILNIYHKDKDKKIPQALRLLTCCIIRRHRCCKIKSNVDPQDVTYNDTNKDTLFDVNDVDVIRSKHTCHVYSQEMKWTIVARALDSICFVLFVLIIFMYFIGFYFVHYW